MKHGRNWTIFTLYSQNYEKYFTNFKNSITSNKCDIKFDYSKTVNFPKKKSNQRWCDYLEYLKTHPDEYLILCDTTSIANREIDFDILQDIEQCDMMFLKGFHSERSKINVSFIIVKSNEKVIRLFEKIKDMIEERALWEQDVVDYLVYSNNYNKSLEDSRHAIVWRYIPDKFVIIVSDREDSIIDVPKDASLYKFIRRDRLKTYQSFLDYFKNIDG